MRYRSVNFMGGFQKELGIIRWGSQRKPLVFPAVDPLVDPHNSWSDPVAVAGDGHGERMGTGKWRYDVHSAFSTACEWNC